MNYQQEHLIVLLINNTKPAWEIEAIYNRCLAYYGENRAFHECQEVINFANLAEIDTLESFRLQVEIAEMLK